ncbi:MAG: 2-hydroxyacyl-CoA dehydratase [Spirochaetes bacterium]|nr:2-hydroxyacyl-CoA dehydratase [Spirochaetota bacterium]
MILGKDRWQVWEEAYESIEILQDIFSVASEDLTHNALLKIYKGYFHDLFTAIDKGKKIIYGNFAVPGTLMRGFDTDKVFWYQLEALSVIQSLVGEPGVWNAKLADSAEAAGMAPEICSVDRIAHGSWLEKVVPIPDACFYLTTPCDSQTCLVNNMVNETGKPTIVLDMPYQARDEDIRYIARQFRVVVKFLEDNLKIKYDFGRLKHACETYNKMMENISDWVELRRPRPSAQPCETLSLMAAVVTVFSGHQSGLDYATETLKELKNFRKNGVKTVTGDEVRAIWVGTPYWTDLNFYNWLEGELNVTVPMDMFGYYHADTLIDTSSEDSMLVGIARNAMRNFPMTRQLLGSYENYLDDYRMLARNYDADFAVIPGHLGCTHGHGVSGLMREESDKMGLPLLSFEFDMLDPRVNPRDDVEVLFRNFVNDIVLPKKAARS